MIKSNYNFTIFFTILFILLSLPNLNNANETLIYADDISYDENENIIAKGNAKIFYKNEFIFSDLIIYEKKNEKIILPNDFTLKDNKNNYYSGSNGIFEKNLNKGEFDNPKIQLNDGSRIVGKFAKRDGHIDIITKGVYTPCKSRIKIGNFICPTWQLEGEKILHDNKNLFLYQKHSKMRVINTPVYYIPYIVTPSPLRKKRKSGFLSPSISFNFFDTKTSQSISAPYYFNISVDKELTFTPIVKYGAGVDSSQRFILDYNQIISGGNLGLDLTFDSNFERENNNKWFSDASLITNYSKNLNETYRVGISSALQTSKNYIQLTNPDDDLSYTNSLSTSVTLEGFNINKLDDRLKANLSFYQTNQNDEDNKTIPTVLPAVEYYTGNSIIGNYNNSGVYTLYNIFRDKGTDTLAQNQQKISHTLLSNREFIKYNSKISLNSEIHNQLFNTENKKINSIDYHTGSYYRIFPIFGMSINTPFRLKKNLYDLTYSPKAQIVITPGISNTNKLSNEDSSNNSFSLTNFSSLNRYSGTDKLDNSKRLNYSFDIYNNKIKLNLSQSYEFTDNSNFHFGHGNNSNLSDLLGSAAYTGKYNTNYNFRYDFNEDFMKEQNLGFSTTTFLGSINASYLDQKSKINNIIQSDTETLNYTLNSKKFLKFSSVGLSGLYDLKKEINSEYALGYRYFDECFGINIDFRRKSYEEDTLKPQDILSIMFSFKNIGSYRSTNLAVSENDKQDIRWESFDVDNQSFEQYNN